MRWGLSLLVEKAPEAIAGDIQRPRRERRRQADVPRRVQAPSVHRAGVRLLRMDHEARRQAALFHLRCGRLGHHFLPLSCFQGDESRALRALMARFKMAAVNKV